MAFWNRLFGYRTEQTQEKNTSFVARSTDDGAVVVDGANAYGTYVDIDGTVRNEFELITRYREMALQPECDSAIDDIVNESIIGDKSKMPVSINLDKTDFSDAIKERLQSEFETVLTLMNFGNTGYETFRKWYVDGRLFYHAIVDPDEPTLGIKELKYIDPRQIQKIKEVQRTRDQETGIELIQETGEYYIYNERGMIGNISGSANTTGAGVKISPDVVVYAHSGIIDTYSQMILSNLHKAYKAWNQLRMIEDAVIIYRITRAPERRVFYIDVGTMPKTKAEQYLKDIMNKYKNRMSYDVNTGETRNDKRYMTMTEDFWLPRSSGREGTKIEPLPGGQNLGEIQDVEYFQKKLYRALNVPLTRMQADSTFSFGKGSSITRDELKFAKFIGRLRSKFSMVFDEIMKKQLTFKQILTLDEWEKAKEKIHYDYVSDSFYEEIKEAEVLRDRLDLASATLSFIPKYYSENYVRKNILKQSEEDVDSIKKDNEEAAVDAETASPESQDFIDKTPYEQEHTEKYQHEVIPGEKYEHTPEKYEHETEEPDYYQDDEDEK